MLKRLRQMRPGTPLWQILLYEFSRLMTVIVATLIYRYRAYGASRIPPTGALLLIANHQSFLDPPAVGLAVTNRQLDYVARFGLFRSRIFSRIITLFNALPIREDSGDAAAIREILRRLGEGKAVLIFPEGARTPDGRMRPFKRGVALLVKRAKCPVVPVAVEGCFDAWPRTNRMPRIWNASISTAVGDPIDHETLMADGPEAALERLASEVDHMRLALRRQMRRRSRGRYPHPGKGDLPIASGSARGENPESDTPHQDPPAAAITAA